MADDVTVSGVVVSTDEATTVNGVTKATKPHLQRMRTAWGPAGAPKDVTATAGEGLPIQAIEGAIVGIGSTTDAAATGDGGLIGILKRVRTLLNGGLPAALGALGGLKVENQNAIKGLDGATLRDVAVDASSRLLTADGTVSRYNQDSISIGHDPTIPGFSTADFAALVAPSTGSAVKAGAGKLVGWHVYNPNGSDMFVNFYNNAASGSVVGTVTPRFVIRVPALEWNIDPIDPTGIDFPTAITVAATTLRNGTVAPGTGLEATFFYS